MEISPLPKKEKNMEEEMEKVREVIRRYRRNPDDPFFETEKGKKFVEHIRAIDKLMEGK